MSLQRPHEEQEDEIFSEVDLALSLRAAGDLPLPDDESDARLLYDPGSFNSQFKPDPLSSTG